MRSLSIINTTIEIPVSHSLPRIIPSNLLSDYTFPPHSPGRPNDSHVRIFIGSFEPDLNTTRFCSINDDFFITATYGPVKLKITLALSADEGVILRMLPTVLRGYRKLCSLQ
jgi:hypothetical protein